MVFINPGNPTGQCLSEANLKEILHLCFQENLVLLADEVYQQNIYQDERPFISARKVNNCKLLLQMLLKFCFVFFLAAHRLSKLTVPHTLEAFDGHGPTH